MISQKSIEEIRDRARVEEVVADFVNLKRRGSNMIGLCPFHHEKTPSFSVSPTKNLYKCFGCGKGGDPISFVMEHEGYDYPEALRYLAAKYGIQIEENQADAATIQAEKERETIYKVLDFAWNFYKNQLHDTEEGQVAGLNYFKERGFRSKTIESFGLGYAPEQPDALLNACMKNGFTLDILQRAGLVTQHKTDFFRHRVIFPIFNISGKVIAFAGRQMVSSTRGPKYINSPETEIYVKRKVLYGISHAKKAIRDLDNCFLVEGYTDVISLNQAGIENVVASSGTALTPEQIRLIKRYAGRITVLYDSDPAGIKAAMRGLDLILEENMDVRLALLPEGEDPDSFVKKNGMAGFQDYIKEHSKDFILFKTQLLLKEAQGDPMRKSTLIKELVETLAHIPEAIKRSAFITECAHLMKIDEHILVRETNKAVDDLLRQKRQGVPREIDQSERELQHQIFQQDAKQAEARMATLPKPTDFYQERDIVRILLNYGHKELPEADQSPLSRYILLSILDIIEDFQDELYKKIILEYRDLLEQGISPGQEHFTSHSDKRIKDLALELLSFPFEYAAWEEHDIPLQVQLHPDINYKTDAMNAILRLKLKMLMNHIGKNLERIAELQETGNEDELIIHVRIHDGLLKMREQITSQFKNVVLNV
jgi:DNA primase